MGSFYNRKSLGILGKGNPEKPEMATDTRVNNDVRHTHDTFEYSTKAAYEMDDYLFHSTEAFSNATVESLPQSYVDYQLQALHEELTSLPVPERFQLLLDTLERKKD